jgi:phosphoribosylformylglycinamidine (FGAM) synthase-like amidotransferase family enzyme
MPEDVEDTVAEWLAADDGSIGQCLVCGCRIMTEVDLVPGTNDHRCARRDLS